MVVNMTEKEFLKLVDKDKYQVFILSSPVPIPLNFAVHTWFVVNLKGEVHRWEFGYFRGSPCENEVGVLKDFFRPTTGMNFYFWKSEPRFRSKLAAFIEGGDDSIARDMALFIEENSYSYPLKNIYRFKGPNSNTYMQWVLDKFPSSNLKLPFNSFGKGYKI
jgi:hypothetical protein